MAITGGTLIGQSGLGSTVRVESQFRIQFDLDDSYPTGGYTDFAATVKAITGIGTRVTIVDIVQAAPCGGYKLWYDRVNDTLMVYEYPTSQGPSTEVGNGTDLSTAGADCEMVVHFV